jgi:hypothetical protein
VIVTDDAMPWLADTDVSATLGFARSLDALTDAELRRRALVALGELVPSDVLTWDRVELATGAVRHEAVQRTRSTPVRSTLWSPARPTIRCWRRTRRTAGPRCGDRT